MAEENKQIALIQIRDTADEVARERQAILRATGLRPDQLRSVNAPSGADLLSALDGVSAVIIGGSRYSVFEEMPRRADLIELVNRTQERGLPMFGICFGLQLIAQTFGGRVERDFENRKRGTFDIQLTAEADGDPLFSVLPKTFAAQCSHQDRVVALPDGARVLAMSERCPVQGFVLPGRIYGVQFHPERTKEEMEQIYGGRTYEMAKANWGLSLGGAPLRDTPEAALLLQRFVDLI
ncbi:MAG: type 1 glutamine amidotransferase [Patescibacteria group bacterium]